jgi:hypothetical protein
LYGRANKLSLLNKVVNMTAKRYWISPERGYSVIDSIRDGKIKTSTSKNKMKLYLALYDEFVKFKEKNPNMSDMKIAEEIVFLPAPCFGLEPRVAGFIINKMEKICRKEKINRLNALYQQH